jgi:hypothetical protein
LTRQKIARVIADVSIAALRSWLESKGLQHSAGTRDAMVDRLGKLFDKGKLADEEFIEGLTGIEEASAKRIFLYRVGEESLAQLSPGAFGEHLTKLNLKLSPHAILAARNPGKPELVYVLQQEEIRTKWAETRTRVEQGKEIRAKWAETQTRVEFDVVTQEFHNTKVTKVVVLSAETNPGLVQLRCDKPENLHGHRDEHGNPSQHVYQDYYRQQATKLLGVDLTPVELRPALKSLVETVPHIVRVPLNAFRTGANSRVRFAAKNDVRDDDDYEAMHDEGGASWAHDRESVFWLPSASNGALTREVFTDIDARNSSLRVDADCHEGEIRYAISRIREHQERTSAP